MTPTVAIAGAGIGGLTLAIALRRRGVPVTVLERASELKPAGAGIALGPNAIVALERLGLRSAIVGAGASIGRSAILDSDGRVLGAELDVAALEREVGAPVVALQRTRLHDVLVDAAGPGVVRLGFTVLEYENLGDRVRVISTEGDRVEADLLVGADGLNSSVRAQLVSDGAPKYSGYTSWRGVTPAGAVAPPQRMTESWGRGERFGIVNIGSGEIYWFAVANAKAGGTDADVREELLARFGGWHEPVAAIVRATPAARILRTDISDRDPIDCWHRGPVVLLGDAAHPMTPNLGQGAGQAIEDAVVLDQCLSAGPTIDAAVRRYEVRRVSRANRLVLASRRVGAIAQWQNAAAVWLRDTGMRLTPASVAISQARRIMQAEI
ncbi:MAG TPA: FAD-dependent monooxygenase [Vicinamibacterales bacterium]|nr:FAD-dependent monooxygenase [Vicinamibacterales bacterium]